MLANVGVGEIALPAGDYFLQIKPVAGAGCKAFLHFSIAKEPINFVPFRDDFSNQFATLSRSSIYAQYEKWEIGKQVYVNATLPIDPPTIGVATFDGLDEYGLPYFVSDTLQTGSADTLLSRPFCEFSQYAANPLYLSFFFQAKGNGDIPNPPDSLVLELKDNRGIWNKVWEMRGEALQAYLDTFTMVSFRIKDDLISDGGDTATFYADDFQFRFRNKATITGYNDHWHIDYVQITPDSLMQTSLQDVGFIYPAKPMLKRYWAMPWKHFIDNTDTEYSENIQFTLRNNSSVSNGGIQLNLRTSEMCSGMILKDSLYRTAPALEPLIPYIIDYAEVAGGTVPLRRNIVFNDEDFDDRRDVVLRSEYYFDDGSGALDVDQVTQDQIFSNYFAYDDGSAEKAYGLQGASAELAYRFYLNKPDSITGIKVYFTDIVGDLAANRLEFKVWKSIDFEDNPDVSDSTLYVSSEVQYRLSENERDCFAKYDFGTKIPVDSVFYIGFRQIDEDPLNIGFDVNSLGIDTLYIEKIDSITQSGDTIKHTESLYTPLNFGRKNLFYNADGVWRQSIQFGSLMLQPIMANNFNVTYTGNEELPLEQAAETAVRIYPNPTENLLNIQVLSDDFNQYIVKLYDLSGKMHLQAQNESQIYLGDLPDGLYMIEIQSLQQNNAFVRHKIIKH
ncbi:MAG: T9SS type A sorting domain-containing protein [Sphingobacteriales bacterium]|nr:T9SS type A sorting domain-containing protein [Sphingobacteriales bacterium]